MCFVDALGHCEHLMIRGKSKKEMEPVFQDHCILYIPIRANVTGEEMGMCELLSLRLPNSPFTGLKGKRKTEHYLQWIFEISFYNRSLISI